MPIDYCKRGQIPIGIPCVFAGVGRQHCSIVEACKGRFSRSAMESSQKT